MNNKSIHLLFLITASLTFDQTIVAGGNGAAIAAGIFGAAALTTTAIALSRPRKQEVIYVNAPTGYNNSLSSYELQRWEDDLNDREDALYSNKQALKRKKRYMK